MADGYVLAIDFGTSNTCASVRRAGGPPSALRLGYDTNAMPSAVLLQGEDVLVGDDAVRLAALDPASFERTPKRRLGQGSMMLGGREVDPVDLVAAVLRRALEQARVQSRAEAPDSVVITHPAVWGPHLTGLLVEAATRAGADPGTTTLLAEPLAAAWSHAAGGAVASGESLAVVDFGGGTFDVAHLRVSGTPGGLTITVAEADGLDPLGGDDFDGQLDRWLRSQLRADGRTALLDALDAEDGLGARLTTRDGVTRAKHALSHHASAPIVVAAGGERAVVTVTVAELEELIAPSVARAVAVTRRLLADVAVDHLFLTGGSSLIPLVQRAFQTVSGGRVGTLGDPKEVTSLGALVAPVVRTATPARAPAGQAPTAAITLDDALSAASAAAASGAKAPVTPPAAATPGDGRPTEAVPPPPGDAPPGEPPTPDVPSDSDDDGEAASGTRSGRDRRVRLAAVFGLLLAVVAAGSIWIGTSRGDARADGTDTTTTTTSGTITTTSDTVTTTTTTEPPTNCGSMNDQQCALAASNAGIVKADSCQPWNSEVGEYGIYCTPDTTSDVTLPSTATLYLYKFASVDAMRQEAEGYFRGVGVDIASVTETDLSQSPSTRGWDWASGATGGKAYAYHVPGDDISYLIWTYDDQLTYCVLGDRGNVLADLERWWETT